MRKCDICGTNIPFSTDRCPNCGYQYKPERKIDGYMSQFQPHPSPLDDLKKTTKTITPKNYSSNHSMMKYIGIIVPVISLIVMVSIFVTQISSKIFDLYSPSFSTGELETYYPFYHYEDLSSNFETGGGAESTYMRVKQVIKTVNANTETPAYLYINGHQANVIGGEGIMVRQPLNERSLDE